MKDEIRKLFDECLARIKTLEESDIEDSGLPKKYTHLNDRLNAELAEYRSRLEAILEGVGNEQR